jgi:hypothetical protein
MPYKNSEYDNGSQKQIKKAKTRSSSPTLKARHTIWQSQH